MEPTAENVSGNGEAPTYEKRWWSHAVLSMSLVIIVGAVSSLNVTLPSLVRELEVTGTELQWIMDAYVLAFGGLLLFFGALGDRFGRKGALQLGLGLFGISTLLAATVADNAAHLILLRVSMGVGAALIMPATLSIIAAIFPVAERPKAIAVFIRPLGYARPGTGAPPPCHPRKDGAP
jgi:MFS family permease